MSFALHFRKSYHGLDKCCKRGCCSVRAAFESNACEKHHVVARQCIVSILVKDPVSDTVHRSNRIPSCLDRAQKFVVKLVKLVVDYLCSGHPVVQESLRYPLQDWKDIDRRGSTKLVNFCPDIKNTVELFCPRGVVRG